MSQPATPAATGAMPATGATPAGAAEGSQNPQPTSATPAASTTQQPKPATGEEALGDPGKAALASIREELRTERDARKAAEDRAKTLEDQGKTESEKATATAVKAAEQATSDRFTGLIRNSEVRRALTAAGIGESELGLAAMAPEFARLKVGDDGEIDKLGDVVTAFKAAHPSLFAKPGNQTPDYGGGARPGGATLTRDEINRMSPAEAAARMPEIDAFLRSQGAAR